MHMTHATEESTIQSDVTGRKQSDAPTGIAEDLEIDFDENEIRCQGPINLRGVAIIGKANIKAFTTRKTP